MAVKDMAPELISRWRVAYKLANEREAPPMKYEAGYFVLRNPIRSAYRRTAVERMIATLENRISRSQPSLKEEGE